MVALVDRNIIVDDADDDDDDDDITRDTGTNEDGFGTMSISSCNAVVA